MSAKKTGSKPMTKTEILRSISEITGLQKKDVVAVMEALTDEIKKALKSSGIGVFSIPGLVKVERRKVPASGRKRVSKILLQVNFRIVQRSLRA